MPEETRRKISATLKGRVMTPEHRAKIAAALKGNKNCVGRRISPSLEARRKLSESTRGPKHWRWIPDRSKLKDNKRDGRTKACRDWSKAVKDRDGWKCQLTDSNCSEPLEAHHILNWKDNPEGRLDTDNGITLCFFHHPRTRWEEKHWAAYLTKLVI